MPKTRGNRKAVSPVIATLLMIAIAVAASVVMYSWVNTMVKNQSTQSPTAIRIEEVQFDAEVTGQLYYFIKISIRNTGTVGAVIKTVYVYQQDTQLYKFDDLNIAFSANQLQAIGFTDGVFSDVDAWESACDLSAPDVIKDRQTMSIGLQTATSYLIKVVTDIGYIVEGTYYTPNSFHVEGWGMA